ncbi:hypothetical protein HOK51_08460 [Candidatus Woesearchaeota archaeon]|jgi:hypothetical protein|nr:hypothetical protein [Candidatus Woesearchaeota archaeon]MBT6519858.1 hypothetical protein [Candidatus Woesearchaeota archaeon]MBT7367150.1 hypothetical protein [Candidatus Woesearchaeota archaeon]
MKQNKITTFAAVMAALGIASSPVLAEEVFVNNDGQVCVRDVLIDNFTEVSHDLLSNARDSAGEIYSDFIGKVFGEEAARKLGDAGLITTEFAPKKVKGNEYNALCDVCSTVNFSPEAQDKMLDSLGVKEETINTKVYGSEVLSTSEGTLNNSTSTTRVRSYIATTRSRPYVDALVNVMNKHEFSPEKRIGTLKNIADENGVIHKNKAKSVYKKWMRMLNNQSSTDSVKTEYKL